MQLLLHAGLSHPHLPAMADGAERHNLFLFYELSLLLMDAVYALHGAGEEENL